VLAVNEYLPQESLNFFNTSVFFKLHATSNSYYFQWLVHERPVLTLNLSETEEGCYVSPVRGTYGGIDGITNVRHSESIAFINEVERFLNERGASKVRVILPPSFHDLHGVSLQQFLLESQGYHSVFCDINYSAPVDAAAFETRTCRDSKRRLKKLRSGGLSVTRGGSEMLEKVYGLIEVHHSAKNFRLSMTMEQLALMLNVYPDNFELFCGELDGVCIAAVIGVHLNDNIFYIFKIADLPGYERFSPSIAMVQACYDHAYQCGCKFLDYGISSVAGVPNLGLMNFKRGLGFSETLKVTMEKSLGS